MGKLFSGCLADVLDSSRSKSSATVFSGANYNNGGRNLAPANPTYGPQRNVQ